jgi:hypothetical protein
MIRLSLFALAFALAVSLVTVTPGIAPSAAAAEKKKPEKKKAKKKGRNDYTAEERKKIMDRARQVCRESEGAPSRVYRIDYKKMVVYCMPASAG